MQRLSATIIPVLALLAAGCAGEDLRRLAPAAANTCTPWVELSAFPKGNAEARHEGCSNEFNLRAMLEEPRDFERGRVLAPADGTRESGVLELYESGPRKPFGAAAAAVPTVMLSAPEGAGK